MHLKEVEELMANWNIYNKGLPPITIFALDSTAGVLEIIHSLIDFLQSETPNASVFFPLDRDRLIWWELNLINEKPQGITGLILSARAFKNFAEPESFDKYRKMMRKYR